MAVRVFYTLNVRTVVYSMQIVLCNRSVQSTAESVAKGKHYVLASHRLLMVELTSWSDNVKRCYFELQSVKLN